MVSHLLSGTSAVLQITTQPYISHFFQFRRLLWCLCLNLYALKWSALAFCWMREEVAKRKTRKPSSCVSLKAKHNIFDIPDGESICGQLHPPPLPAPHRTSILTLESIHQSVKAILFNVMPRCQTAVGCVMCCNKQVASSSTT